MSLDKIKYLRQRRADLLEEEIRERYGRSKFGQNGGQTIPKFQRVLSSSQVSQLSSRQNKLPNREKKSFTNMKLYSKLNHKLDQIKETIKQSLISVGQRKQKQNIKRKDRIITEISEHEPNHKQRNKRYNDILEHIAEMKARSRSEEARQTQPQGNTLSSQSQRTLFYGIDFIDSVELKIKLKLSKTNYYLFAKNNHTKIMVEMSYGDYMKLHLGELRGNPCNIFRYLMINGNKIQLKLRNNSGNSLTPSLKSYVGYY